MQEKIAVFDANNIKIGSTFHRRAKQLVGKGRAVWQGEGQTAICLTSKEEPTSREIDMENISSGHDPGSELLLYIAKENVKRKRNLLKHIIALIIVAPLLVVFYTNFLGDALATSANASANSPEVLTMIELRLAGETFSRNHNTAAVNTIAQAMLEMAELAMLQELTADQGIATDLHAAWYFTWGAYAAWGLYVLTRLVQYLSHKGAGKKDPVLAEYNRLKRSAGDVVDLRTNG